MPGRCTQHQVSGKVRVPGENRPDQATSAASGQLYGLVDAVGVQEQQIPGRQLDLRALLVDLVADDPEHQGERAEQGVHAVRIGGARTA